MRSFDSFQPKTSKTLRRFQRHFTRKPSWKFRVHYVACCLFYEIPTLITLTVPFPALNENVKINWPDFSLSAGTCEICNAFQNDARESGAHACFSPSRDYLDAAHVSENTLYNIKTKLSQCSKYALIRIRATHVRGYEDFLSLNTSLAWSFSLKIFRLSGVTLSLNFLHWREEK